jgi:acetyl-CoA synthetase
MDEALYNVSPEWARRAHVDAAAYQDMYAESMRDPDGFWREHGNRIDWFTPFTKVRNASFGRPGSAATVSIRWFEDGVTNVAHNCIDRHLGGPRRPGRDHLGGRRPGRVARITYRELHSEVCRMANVLRNRGVGARRPGDHLHADDPGGRLCDAGLRPARRRALRGVRWLFAGFSRLAHRGCSLSHGDHRRRGLRGGRKVALKANVDAAIERLGPGIVDHVVVVRRTGGAVAMSAGRDVYYDEAAAQVTDECPAEPMNAEDPLFLLLHFGIDRQAQGCGPHHGRLPGLGLVHAPYVFDYHDGDIYWCTADVGWVTGHSYILYGPLANGATTLMFEGIPTYPTISGSGRWSTSTASTSSTPPRPRSAR